MRREQEKFIGLDVLCGNRENLDLWLIDNLARKDSYEHSKKDMGTAKVRFPSDTGSNTTKFNLEG